MKKRYPIAILVTTINLLTGCTYVGKVIPNTKVDSVSARNKHGTLAIDGRMLSSKKVTPRGTSLTLTVEYGDALIESLRQQMEPLYENVYIARNPSDIKDYDEIMTISNSFEGICNQIENGLCTLKSTTNFNLLRKDRVNILSEKISDDFEWHAPSSALAIGTTIGLTMFVTAPVLVPIALDIEGPDFTKAISDSNERVVKQIAEVVSNKFYRDESSPSTKSPEKNQTTKKSGSAFFINSLGQAITNAHVVNECSTSTAIFQTGETVKASIVSIDKQNDLALVKVESINQHHGNLRVGIPIRQGEPVIAFGYPISELLASSGTISTGIISAMAGIGDDSRMFQISAPVQPGNSGGPLFDQYGNVVGVVTSKLNAIAVSKITGDIPQNVNFAIKASVLSNFLESIGVEFDQSGSKKLVTTEDITDKAKSFTFKFECY